MHTAQHYALTSFDYISYIFYVTNGFSCPKEHIMCFGRMKTMAAEKKLECQTAKKNALKSQKNMRSNCFIYGCGLSSFW